MQQLLQAASPEGMGGQTVDHRTRALRLVLRVVGGIAWGHPGLQDFVAEAGDWRDVRRVREGGGDGGSTSVGVISGGERERFDRFSDSRAGCVSWSQRVGVASQEKPTIVILFSVASYLQRTPIQGQINH